MQASFELEKESTMRLKRLGEYSIAVTFVLYKNLQPETFLYSGAHFLPEPCDAGKGGEKCISRKRYVTDKRCHDRHRKFKA